MGKAFLYGVTGGGSTPTLITKNITANGTYTAQDDNADGYSSVTVSVAAPLIEKDVNFYDYDGTLVSSYNAADFANLTAVPANPTHTGLVAQGWNYTLADAKTYVESHGKLNIGQTYRTASGLSEFDIELTKATGLSVTFTMTGTKDWGDGTTDSATSHTYASYGKYTIKCNGTILQQYVMDQSSSVPNYTLKAVRLSTAITSITDNAFMYCSSLLSITIPKNVYTIGQEAFASCHSLRAITIPSSVTSIGIITFASCASITSVAIPNGITSIKSSMFQDCRCLTSITIPNSVTSIDASAFRDCRSLNSVTIPSNVTEIKDRAFQYCFVMTLYDFTAANEVPTLSNSNAFTNINKTAKIVVPNALYDEWIAATNWVTYADYIYKASEIA